MFLHLLHFHTLMFLQTHTLMEMQTHTLMHYLLFFPHLILILPLNLALHLYLLFHPNKTLFHQYHHLDSQQESINSILTCKIITATMQPLILSLSPLWFKVPPPLTFLYLKFYPIPIYPPITNLLCSMLPLSVSLPPILKLTNHPTGVRP
jgi:hypothetical protein